MLFNSIEFTVGNTAKEYNAPYLNNLNDSYLFIDSHHLYKTSVENFSSAPHLVGPLFVLNPKYPRVFPLGTASRYFQ